MTDEQTKATFCDPGLERVIISCCMKKKEALLEVESKGGVSLFLAEPHKELYKTMTALAEEDVFTFDPITVIQEAKVLGKLDKITDGVNYIHAVFEMGDLHLSNFGVFLSKLIDVYRKYLAYTKTVKIQNEILVNKESSTVNKTSYDLVAMAETEFMNMDSTNHLPEEPLDMIVGLEEWLQSRIENPVKISGIPTGFPILDDLIDGLIPGTLNIVAARRKIGKSALLLNIAKNIAFRKPFYPVLFLDTEMPTVEQWRPRLLSCISGVKEKRIRRGTLDAIEKKRVDLAIDLIKKGKLFHYYLPGYTPDQIVSLFKLYRERFGIALGIFDYIKIPSNADLKSMKEYQILGQVTTKLKDLTGYLDIPILCAAQVSREGQVADSDKIERYCDVLVELTLRTKEELEKTSYSPEYGRYKLVVKASRRGGETPDCGIGLDFKKSLILMSQAKQQMVEFDMIEYEDADDNIKLDTDMIDLDKDDDDYAYQRILDNE